eukprot:9468765-Pyramimonas_sp.AAC.1
MKPSPRRTEPQGKIQQAEFGQQRASSSLLSLRAVQEDSETGPRLQRTCPTWSEIYHVERSTEELWEVQAERVAEIDIDILVRDLMVS